MARFWPRSAKCLEIQLIDAAQVPQPDWSDVFEAFVCGAMESAINPTAKMVDYRRAADAYCKLALKEKSPEVFDALGENE